jgi:Sulfatase protein
MARLDCLSNASFVSFPFAAPHHAHHEHHQHHFDNDLPPYQSKIARLNVECADPSMLQDCIAGQKWKCINEDGRWRKHKCKFHREVQNHLAEVNKYLSAHSKRNCACFTPDGVVYTKIKSERDVFQPKQKRFEQRHKPHNGRFKRETADVMDEIYIDQIPPEFLDLLRMDEVVENLQNSLLNQTEQSEEHSRKKRDVDYMAQTIDELNTVLGQIEQKYSNASDGPVQCFVEVTGKVNCSTIVYENERAWKQSRVQIDMLIKVLKSKITNLKDIKRHLKEHRPSNMTYDEDNYENVSSSLEDLEEADDVTKAPRRKTNRTTALPIRPTGTERKRKQKVSTTTTEETSSGYSTDEDYASSSYFSTEESSTASTTPGTSSTTQRQRNRTKQPRTSVPTTTSSTSTVADTSVYEDFSATSENVEDYATSELPELASTTELFSSSSKLGIQERFDEKSVTIDATIIEPKRQKTNVMGNSVNVNVTSDNEHKNVPADCYCEPEFER